MSDAARCAKLSTLLILGWVGEFDHEVGVTEERVGIFDKRTGCGRVEPEER